MNETELGLMVEKYRGIIQSLAQVLCFPCWHPGRLAEPGPLVTLGRLAAVLPEQRFRCFRFLRSWVVH